MGLHWFRQSFGILWGMPSTSSLVNPLETKVTANDAEYAPQFALAA